MVKDLTAGFNWISFNVEPADVSVNAVLSNISHVLVQYDQIKDQLTFAQFYAGYGWYGSLRTLTTDSMYAIDLTNAVTFYLTGPRVAIPKTITVGSGWTYLPYPHWQTRSVNDGLPSGLTFSQNDQLKSQLLFTSYYSSYGWFGSLTQMEPMVGFQLLLNGPGGEATFTGLPTGVAGRRRLAAQRSPMTPPKGALARPSEWAFSPGRFSQSMSVVAMVEIGGANQSAGLLAAFAGRQLRGKAAAPLMTPFGAYSGSPLFHLTVHGDKDGEVLGFAFCDADEGWQGCSDGSNTTRLHETLRFAANAKGGSALDPRILTG